MFSRCRWSGVAPLRDRACRHCQVEQEWEEGRSSGIPCRKMQNHPDSVSTGCVAVRSRTGPCSQGTGTHDCCDGILKDGDDTHAVRKLRIP